MSVVKYLREKLLEVLMQLHWHLAGCPHRVRGISENDADVGGITSFEHQATLLHCPCAVCTKTLDFGQDRLGELLVAIMAQRCA
jgi:hypothetical protein